ncbi:MAG: hypothetical protein JO027_00260 [Solirubrobacterales bacterium]|nr:hypothetical protein [Solirubrobacterales bacterium]
MLISNMIRLSTRTHDLIGRMPAIERSLARALLLGLVFALAGLSASAASAAAATYTVNATDDGPSSCDPGQSCTLREAVSLAGDNPGSTVIVPAGDYVLTSDSDHVGSISVSPGTTIQGAGARTTIIDANSTVTHDRVFLLLASGAPVTLSHLTVTGGAPDANAFGGVQGGDILSEGDLSLDHVRVTAGSAAGGGGVANVGGTLTIDHSLLDSDTATGTSAGGAILSTGSAPSLTVTDSTLTGNGAGDGAGISVSSATSSQTTVRYVTIADNTSTEAAGAGGLSTDGSGTTLVGDSIIAGNQLGTAPANCAGPVTDAGSNVETGTDCGFSGSSDRQNAAPILGTLSDQGGDTDVLPLGAGSPAIDLAPVSGCPATDQRDRPRPQGAACDAGAVEADAPATPQPQPKPQPQPQPQAPPHDHTVLGVVAYAAPFAPAEGDAAEPASLFDLHPTPHLLVSLLTGDGTRIAQERLDPGNTPLSRNGDAEYRFDGLAACGDCRVEVSNGGPPLDSQPVSFDGFDGQTNVFLSFSNRPGGYAGGLINVPDGHTPPAAFSVRATAGGHVIADTASLSPQCPLMRPEAQPLCGSGYDLTYRLSGLPVDNRPVTVTLYERPLSSLNGVFSFTGPPVAVDSATAPLRFGAADFTGLPPLTSLSVIPPRSQGRVLYGHVYARAPFAPGADPLTGEKLAPGDHPVVTLLQGKRQIGTTTVLNSSLPTYWFYGVAPCSSCRVELHDRGRLIDTAPVVLSTRQPSVTERDLQLKDPNGNFIDGTILAPDGVRGDNLRVVVRRPQNATPIADSLSLPQACHPGAPCSGDHVYRLGGVPAKTQVLVTLMFRTGFVWVPVDSVLLQTNSGDVDTIVPDLTLLPGAGAGDPGSQISGSIETGGPYAGGGQSAPVAARSRFQVTLYDPNGLQLATTTVTAGSQATDALPFTLLHLKGCTNCTLALQNGQGTVDEETVSLPDFTSVTTVAPLLSDRLADGAFISGAIIGSRPFVPNNVIVEVFGADGHVRSTTTDSNVVDPCRPTARACASVPDLLYRLGRMPSSGSVTVRVFDAKSRRVLASERVTVAPGARETAAAALRIDLPAR